MKTINKLLAVAAIALIGCGDNKSIPDAPPRPDGPPPDAYCSSCPAAPTVGAQIDRMGRPAINTVLTRGFDAPSTAVTAAKTAYNEDDDPSGWVAANIAQFMKNLAIIDALDTGFCGNGRCELGETNLTCEDDCDVGDTPTGDGCGNQVLFNDPAGTGYQSLAGIMAADELYLDTSKSTCGLYLAVEFGVATGAGNSTCGGRAPQYDVIDFTMSAAAVGLQGFEQPSFTPKFGDGAGAHDDYLTAFPYLGVPRT